MYTLKILNDFEFDSLPFQRSRESLGAANPKTGTAYVRRTGIKPLDAFVTDHEIDELVNKYSAHEDSDGIRYKGGGDILKTLAPIGIGLLTGGIGSALGLGGTMTNVLGTAAGATYSGASTGGKPKEWLPSAAMGGLGGFGGASLGKGAVSGWKGASEAAIKEGGTAGLGAKLGGAVKGMGKTLGFGAAPGSATSSTGAQYSPISMQPAEAGGYMAISPASYAPEGARVALSDFSGGGLGADGLGQGGIRPEGEVIKKPTLLEGLQKSTGTNLGKIALGGAIGTAGQGLAPKVEPFDLANSALFNETLTAVRQGINLELTPAQREAITANFDTELETAKGNLKERFKALRPGSDVENDSAYRQALTDLETEFAELRARATTEYQMTSAQQQTENLSQLAAMDVYQLAQNAQISVEEARSFKELLAQLGVAVASPSPINLGFTA